MQSVPKVEKQSWEEFYIGADFYDVLKSDGTEVLVLASCTVTAVDKDDTDVSDTFTQQATISLDDSEEGYEDNVLKIRVQDGATASSPYKLTFKAISNLGNKWEKDIKVKVKEL